MPELLEVRDLKKYFPVTGGFLKKTVGWVKAVDGVDLTIGTGETFGLVGESGCGKTTVGKLVLRLIEATSGDIRFQGRNIRDLDKKELRALRKEMQIIFQDPYGSLNPRMNIGDIVAEPLRWHRLVDESQVNGRVCKLLDMVGLNGKDMSKYPHEFSGGQRQRIVIARALAVQPKLIVCDEPVSALDVSIQAQILNLLMDLQDSLGLTYMFVTHDLSVVKHISDNIMVMYLGKCVEYASSEELFADPLHPYTRALLAAIPIPDLDERGKELQLIKGEVSSPINVKPGCRFAKRCEFCDERCMSENPPFVEAKPGHKVVCFKVGENGEKLY